MSSVKLGKFGLLLIAYRRVRKKPYNCLILGAQPKFCECYIPSTTQFSIFTTCEYLSTPYDAFSWPHLPIFRSQRIAIAI